MKLYRGFTIEGRRFVEWRHSNSQSHWEDLDPCFFLRRHSPDGFNWGYCGSGPAQLALALLYDVYGAERTAVRYYQRFKVAFVAGLKGDTWETDEFKIAAIINGLVVADKQKNAEGGDCTQ